MQAYVLENHPRMTSVFPSFGMFYTNWVGSYPPTCAPVARYPEQCQITVDGAATGAKQPARGCCRRAADGALVFTLPMDGSSRQPCIDPVRSPEQAGECSITTALCGTLALLWPHYLYN